MSNGRLADEAAKAAFQMLRNANERLAYAEFDRAYRHLGFEGNTSHKFRIILGAYQRDRSYHGRSHASLMAGVTPQEIQSLQAAGLNPNEVEFVKAVNITAAWLHDTVQIQADRGFQRKIAPMLDQYISLNQEPLYQAQIRGPSNQTPGTQIVCAGFGFKPEQTIGLLQIGDTPGGLNEFASTLLGCHLFVGPINLSPLQKKALMANAAAISASDPFRLAVEFDHLFDRVRSAGLQKREAQVVVKGAILFANRDVESFCGGPITSEISPSNRFKNFIAGTWQLMPENNAHLRGKNYSPSDFRNSLMKMRNFLTRILNPQNIFHQFDEFPSMQEMTFRTDHAKRNLMLLEKYMAAKIASSALVEAIAMTLPASIGRTSLHNLVDGIDHKSFGTPVTKAVFSTGEQQIVFEALVDRGDKPAYGWDIKASPIAAFLMYSTGLAGINRINELAKELLEITNAENYRAFLEQIRREYPQALGRIYDAITDITFKNGQTAGKMQNEYARRAQALQQSKSLVMGPN